MPAVRGLERVVVCQVVAEMVFLG
jgi:hypothetical protein